MSSAQPCSYQTPDFAGALGSYQLKLHMIVREMELCKAALGEWRLNAQQASSAHKLIARLEDSVEGLGSMVLSSQHASGSSSGASFEEQLEYVTTLCDQLMSIIFRRPQISTLPA